MKVIGINGSSRKDGNTAIIIRTIFEELNKRGIETEYIQLADVDIEPCRACFACKGKGNCVFRKDGFAEVFSKIVGADGIILGSPVYSADVSSRMKALLDRGGVVAAVNPGILKHKLGVAVAAVRRAGGMTAVDTMNHFFFSRPESTNVRKLSLYTALPGSFMQATEYISKALSLIPHISYTSPRLFQAAQAREAARKALEAARVADPVQARKDFIARQPMERLGKASEIAAMAVYLASDAAAFTTGTTMIIDGGWSL